MQNRGKIIINSTTNVWPHELFIAKCLSALGRTVEFIPANNTHRSADALIDGVVYEFKSPEGSNIRCIERNVKRSKKQSSNIIICSIRVKRIHDRSIYTFLQNNAVSFHGIDNLLFIDRNGRVFDITHKKK